MNKSCRICGFFVDYPTASTGNLGYCLFYDEETPPGRKTGESLKIVDGDEKKLAETCAGYFRKVPVLSHGEFINWRLGLKTFELQKRFDVWAKIITLAAFVIAGVQLYLSLQ
jgi:hypothetical protein